MTVFRIYFKLKYGFTKQITGADTMTKSEIKEMKEILEKDYHYKKSELKGMSKEELKEQLDNMDPDKNGMFPNGRDE